LTVRKVKIRACDKPLLKTSTLMPPMALNTLYSREQLIISVGSTITRGAYTVLLDSPWMVSGLARLRGTCVKPIQFSILMCFMSSLQ
jgi:hypothetical protein